MKRISKVNLIGLEEGLTYEITQDPDDMSYYITNCGISFLKENLDGYFRKANWAIPIEKTTTPSHYDNTNGSLYLFAEQHKLNAWEFEVIKRIVRCRKKGEFLTDIEKTIKVLELYRDEQGDNYKGQFEPLNK